MIKEKEQKRKRRHKKIRAKIKGTSKMYRLCVFRSKKHIYAQLIDDEKSKTVLAANDLELDKKKAVKKDKLLVSEKIIKKESKLSPLLKAKEVGKLIARKARERKIEKVVFDRGGYKYHGRVKALAQGAREEGLKF